MIRDLMGSVIFVVLYQSICYIGASEQEIESLNVLHIIELKLNHRVMTKVAKQITQPKWFYLEANVTMTYSREETPKTYENHLETTAREAYNSVIQVDDRS